MSASTNIFNINISDHEVRITFMDQRPAVPGTQANSLVTDIVAEVVMAPANFRQLLDMGDKLLADHAATKEKQGVVN